MRVCDDGGRPERDQEAADFLRSDKGRLDMDMGVNQARNGIKAPGIQGLLAFIAARAGDQAIDNGNIPLTDLARTYIHNPAVFDDQVGGFPPCSHIDQVF